MAVIDPNTAPWWELAVLPRIGETTANSIVRYRESMDRSAPDVAAGRAFIFVGDLQAVRGIGPKTVERIAPYLSLPRAE
jgi:DNA uptake protein ComE-like DNA-binding protein